LLLLLFLLFFSPVLISDSFIFSSFLISADNLILYLIHIPIEIKVSENSLHECKNHLSLFNRKKFISSIIIEEAHSISVQIILLSLFLFFVLTFVQPSTYSYS